MICNPKILVLRNAIRVLVASLLVTVLTPVAFSGEPAHLDPPNLPEIKTPDFAGKSLTVKLPSPISDLCVAGGGRYLLLHLKSLNKLAVFDVSRAKVTKYLPTGSSNILFAGGADKIVIVLKDKNLIQRWDLNSLERELTLPIDTEHEIANIAMGSASNGPILIGSGDFYRTGNRFYDLKTLKPAEMDTRNQNFRVHTGSGSNVRVSPDGKTFGMWRTGTSPSGVQVVKIEGRNISSKYEHNSEGAIIPSADGKSIFTGRGVYSSNLQKLYGHSGAIIPAASGNYYLTFKPPAAVSSRTPAPSKSNLTLYMVGRSSPLVTIPDIAVPKVDRFGRSKSPISFDQRIQFIPDAKVIVRVADTDDALTVHKVDVIQALEDAEIDYLFIQSDPEQRYLSPGEQFTYQMRVRSKRGGVRYHLDSAPEGMMISSKGRVKWRVPKDAQGTNETIILSVSDNSDQEEFQTFVLKITSHGQDSRPFGDHAEDEQPKSHERVVSGHAEHHNKRPGSEARSKYRFRIWTDGFGVSKGEGRFFSSDETHIEIETRAGRIVRISKLNLSDFDRGYVAGVETMQD